MSNPPLTVLYTHNLRGDLDLLPRLYTWLQRLRSAAPGPCVLLDLGASCVPDVWPCAVTGGRSTLFVLDAMNYQAARVSDVLAPESVESLAAQTMMALVDAGRPHLANDLLFAVTAADIDHDLTYQWAVLLNPAARTECAGRELRLSPVQAGEVGRVELAAAGGLRFTIERLPPHTPADPTIAGTVDFVRGEARYFESRRQG
ncbi:MAG: hypothetical protein ACOCZH_06185 [Phototrophicaceae bacterium]